MKSSTEPLRNGVRQGSAVPAVVRWVRRAAMVSAFVFVSVVRGAQAPPASQPVPSPEALAERQQIVRDRLTRLEDRLFRLSQKLAETEPRHAERLRQVLQRYKEALLAKRVEQAEELLRNGSLSEAAEVQAGVAADLAELLTILLSPEEDAESLQRQIDRLARLQREVEQLIEEQQRHREATAEAAGPGSAADAADRIRALLEAQRLLAERTRSRDGGRDADPADLQRGQSQLSEQARRLAGEVEGAARRGGGDGEREGAQPSTRSGEMEAARHLRSAAGRMDQAARALESDDSDSASQAQHEALERLEAALRAAEGADKGGEGDAPEEPEARIHRLAEDQQRTAERAESLAQDMQGEGQPGSQGQGGGESGAQPAPGAGNVQRAAGQMRRAAEHLRQQRPRDAVPRQDQALEELRQAQQALEDQLQQLRERQMEEMLEDIETRLRLILEAQARIYRDTADLDGVPREAWARAERLRARELGEQQEHLGAQVGTLRRILTEDATTVVFPHILSDVEEDMADVSRRLASLDVGAGTQWLQQDIIATLQEMLEAVQRQQEMGRGAGGSSGSAGGNAPLLPSSAELKLLRLAQVRLAERTARVEAQRSEERAGTEAAVSLDVELRRLAERQNLLAETARQMHERVMGD